LNIRFASEMDVSGKSAYGPGTVISLPTGWRSADYTDWHAEPHGAGASEAKSDGLTHPGRRGLK
jgi:hypothetical protein